MMGTRRRLFSNYPRVYLRAIAASLPGRSSSSTTRSSLHGDFATVNKKANRTSKYPSTEIFHQHQITGDLIELGIYDPAPVCSTRESSVICINSCLLRKFSEK